MYDIVSKQAARIAVLDGRIAELQDALRVAMTALCSWRSYMEATSDGASRPSHQTASRLYDQCSDAIATCDRIGIEPVLSAGPED